MIKSLKLVTLFLCIKAVCTAQSDSTSSFEIIQLKQQLARTTNDTSRALIMAELSYIYAYSDFDSSLLYARQALGLAQEIDFARGKANALCGFGNLYLRQGDYPQALQYQLQALQLSEKYYFEEEKAISLMELGYTYQYLSDYSRSMTFLKQSRAIYSKISSDNFKRLENEIAISNVYMATNKKDSALACMQQLYNEPRNHEMLMVIFQVMGNIYTSLHNYPAATNFLHQAITLDMQKNDLYSLIWAYNSIARLYQVTKQIDSCIYYAKKGLSLSEKIQLKEGILVNSLILSQEYEPINAGEALYYRKIFDEINNKLYGQEKVLALQKTLAEEQDRQRQVEAKSTAYEYRVKQYAFAGSLGVMILVSLFLFRNNRQKQKANKLLAEQKRKIESTLSALKSTQSQLIQSEKMASLGELTAGIAHEIQNPLNFVNNFSEVNKELVVELEEELKAGRIYEASLLANDIKENEEKINHHGQRADLIVKGMLQHSRTSSGQKELTDINALCDEYLRLSYHGLRAKDQSFNSVIKTDLDETVGNINIIPQDIGRVVLNLINNAFYAVSEKRKQNIPGYEPNVFVSTKILNGKVEIKVKDNGNGIPDSIKDKIFQPFFTTKPTGQGTGLGLSLSYDIVKAHGGEIRVDSSQEIGSEFIIQLPT